MSSVFDGAEPDNEFPAFANLPWQTDLTSAVEGAAAGLAADNNLREHLLDWLSRQPRSSMAYILDRSQERPSHYKWCLARWDRSQARIVCACARRNSAQEGPARRGAGSMPALRRIF